MADAGLVPREHYSGGSVHRGAITKTGNAHLRRVLIEAGSAYRRRPATIDGLRQPQTDQPPGLVVLAGNAQHRLYKRYRTFVGKAKVPLYGATLVARPLLGFIWAIGQAVEPAPPRVATLYTMRALVIIARLFPLFVSVLRDVRRWIWWGAPAVRDAAFHQRRAQYLLDTVTALGPTFVKMAQIFASRADLIPEPYVSRLSTLQDRVKPVPTPAVRAEIEKAFGVKLDALFERFDDTPIAAASLGQVHRAR